VSPVLRGSEGRKGAREGASEFAHRLASWRVGGWALVGEWRALGNGHCPLEINQVARRATAKTGDIGVGNGQCPSGIFNR